MEDDNRLSYFFLGLGIGVAVGVLFAPKSGEETREFIRSKANEGTGYLKTRASEGTEYVKRRADEARETAEEYVDRGRTVITRQKDHLAAAVEAGKAAYREATTAPEKPQGAEGV